MTFDSPCSPIPVWSHMPRRSRCRAITCVCFILPPATAGKARYTAVTWPGRRGRHLASPDPPLSRRWRVIAPDLPGFGRSEKPWRAYTLDFLRGCLFELLETLSIRKVLLVGHSLGGMLAHGMCMDTPVSDLSGFQNPKGLGSRFRENFPSNQRPGSAGRRAADPGPAPQPAAFTLHDPRIGRAALHAPPQRPASRLCQLARYYADMDQAAPGSSAISCSSASTSASGATASAAPTSPPCAIWPVRLPACKRICPPGWRSCTPPPWSCGAPGPDQPARKWDRAGAAPA